MLCRFRWTVGLVAAGAIFGGLITGISTNARGRTEPRVADVVRARQFELLDSAGRPRAVLGTDSANHTGVFVLDPSGSNVTRAALTVGSSGEPELDLRDANGHVRAAVMLNPSGLPTLNMVDGMGRIRVMLELDAAGGELALGDARVFPRVGLSANTSGAPIIALYDASGAVAKTMTLP